MLLLSIRLSNGTKRLVKYIPPNKGKVTIGGRTYPTVKIGNQWWLAENLDYKFQYNGSTLPIGGSGNPTTPHAWYYDNDKASYGIDGTYKCGLMYNWHAAKYLNDNKATLLPNGWHIPTETEITQLINNFMATMLKAQDGSITSNWLSNWKGVDSLGLSIIPSGSRYNGMYGYFNSVCDMWSSTDAVASYSKYGLEFELNGVSKYSTFYYKNGYSVRLIKDSQ